MNSSIPELQQMRMHCALILRGAIERGTDTAVVVCANRLLEIDEQLSPSTDEPMTWKGGSR